MGEWLIVLVLVGCFVGGVLGWFIFGWMYCLYFFESVFEIVIVLLVGVVGGWMWWIVEN